MGFIDEITNPLTITMTHLSVPTNQFRLGEFFRFYIRYDSNKDIRLDGAECYLRGTEQLRRETKGYDPDAPYSDTLLENTLFKQSAPFNQWDIGPSRPLIIDTQFAIPMNKGWTVPGYIEWDLVTVFKIGYKVFGNKFGVTVLPFVIPTTRPMYQDSLPPAAPPEAPRLAEALYIEVKNNLINRAFSKERQSGFELKTIIYQFPIDPKTSQPVNELLLDGCYCIFLQISSERPVETHHVKIAMKYGLVEPETKWAIIKKKWEEVPLEPKKPFVGQFLVRVPPTYSPTLSMQLIRTYYELEIELYIKEGLLGKTVKWKVPLTVLPGIGPEGCSDRPMPFTAWRAYKTLP
jgi:hypothetical protein